MINVLKIAQIRGLITRPNFIIDCYTKYDCGYGKICESGYCVGKLQLDEKMFSLFYLQILQIELSAEIF